MWNCCQSSTCKNVHESKVAMDINCISCHHLESVNVCVGPQVDQTMCCFIDERVGRRKRVKSLLKSGMAVSAGASGVRNCRVGLSNRNRIMSISYTIV